MEFGGHHTVSTLSAEVMPMTSNMEPRALNASKNAYSSDVLPRAIPGNLASRIRLR